MSLVHLSQGQGAVPSPSSHGLLLTVPLSRVSEAHVTSFPTGQPQPGHLQTVLCTRPMDKPVCVCLCLYVVCVTCVCLCTCVYCVSVYM